MDAVPDRIDMSQWVIHFVHGRDPENAPIVYDDRGDGYQIPYHEDPSLNERFWLWDVKDTEQPLEDDADAFGVLLRIVDDGHLRAGWSMRNGRPTIYGPRPAVCFTEMPLFALLQYARLRANMNAVDSYGVAVRKTELFTAGGRPVIYGLSTQHREITDNGIWPRKLHASCNISEDEQFRYVAMNLSRDRSIDWSHEREWRWADVRDECEFPGLPIWLPDEQRRFTSIIVIVRKPEEETRILDEIAQRIDARTNNYDYQYDVDSLQNTRVLTMDTIEIPEGHSLQNLRIDDLRLAEIPQVSLPNPDHATLSRVSAALSSAKQAAIAAAAKNPCESDVFGFAYLMVDDPRSAKVQALLRLGEADATGGIGYRLCNIEWPNSTGSLGQAEAAVNAAKQVLEKQLPDVRFLIRTVWD